MTTTARISSISYAKSLRKPWIFHRPAVANTCDVCGTALIARPDDTPDAVRARLQDYHAKTQPILDLFRRKELVVVVDGTRSVAEVQQDLRRQLAP